MLVVILHPEFHGEGRTMQFCPQVDQFTGEVNLNKKNALAGYRLSCFNFILTSNFQALHFLLCQ
jgi:hypothetical protein